MLCLQLGDFGLATWLSGSDAIMANQSCNTLAGTAAYIPPEAWQNPALQANEAFDVFAFGILIWEVMTAQQPYAGEFVFSGVFTDICTPNALPCRETLTYSIKDVCA